MGQFDPEAELRGAGALLVEPRVMRRAILADRGVVGFGLQVPHTHCYGIRRDDLLRIVDPGELGTDPQSLPREVVLLTPLPLSRAMRKHPELRRQRYRRYIFHARVHLELERSARSGTLPAATVRERIDRIGHTEFDEARAILRQDDLLLPPYDDQQQYIEFVALYLELRRFAPELLAPTFPGLESLEQVDAVIDLDLDVDAVIDSVFPQGRPSFPSERPSSPDRPSGPDRPSDGESREPAAPGSRPGPIRRPPGKWRVKRMTRAGDAARSRGNQVRSALLNARASRAPGQEALAERTLADLRALTLRLRNALEEREDNGSGLYDEQWEPLLQRLAEQAARHPGVRYSAEARLLFDLQRAAIAHERPDSAVDLAGWLFSLGKKPLVRSLPATREVRVARHFRDAARKVPRTGIARSDRKRLAETLAACLGRAEDNVRCSLRPAIASALDAVGLIASSTVEQVARDKLVEELLDEIVDRGFTSYGHLRDALSRNQLKLHDLSSGRQLMSGGGLLKLDRLLARSLDGAYRPGEIYLRALQRLTAPLFGTRVGRFLFLFLILPFGGSYLLLEGLTYIVVNPICGALDLPRFALLTPTSFLATALLTLGLVHLGWLRTAVKTLLGWMGWLLISLFIHLPRWILHQPAVSRFLSIRQVRAALRRIVLPALVASLVPLVLREMWWPWGPHSTEWVTLGVFALIALLMGPRMGTLVDELMFDWVAPRWRTFSNQVLPGLLRLIAELFRRVMNRIEREMYRVDELLRFRAGQSRVALMAVATLGFFWGGLAYFVRMYVTLFVEPELNPLKHFPVATVAHKLTLPILLPVPQATVAYLDSMLPPLPTFLLGVFVSVTVFILPSFFGFLAWELKENRKLYHAARPGRLEPVPLGPHGRTMAELLTPGLHSGALPKLYQRLRRGAQAEDDLARAARAGGAGSGDGTRGYRSRFREGLRQVETDVRRFFERDILALLTRSALWTHGPIAVEAIDCSSNRIRVRLACRGLGPDPCELAFEEQGGFILASIPEPGFIRALGENSPQAAGLLENALVGLYCIAGVDLVNEQIRQAIGERSAYGITGKYLVVFPDQDHRTEVLYKVRSLFPLKRIRPRVRGVRPSQQPPVLERSRLFFDRKAVTWQQWTRAWSDEPDQPVPALLRGPAILPPPPPRG